MYRISHLPNGPSLIVLQKYSRLMLQYCSDCCYPVVTRFLYLRCTLLWQFSILVTTQSSLQFRFTKLGLGFGSQWSSIAQVDACAHFIKYIVWSSEIFNLYEDLLLHLNPHKSLDNVFFLMLLPSLVDLLFIVVQISFFICNGLCTTDDF